MAAGMMDRIGVAIALFGTTLIAHAALPDPVPFALLLACLCAIAGLWLGPARTASPAGSARTMPSLGQGRPAGASTGQPGPLDDELAALDAEVHALTDQFRTQVDAARRAP